MAKKLYLGNMSSAYFCDVMKHEPMLNPMALGRDETLRTPGGSLAYFPYYVSNVFILKSTHNYINFHLRRRNTPLREAILSAG